MLSIQLFFLPRFLSGILLRELDALFDGAQKLDENILFHYLTKYQFYNFDEENEFKKTKQLSDLEEATKTIRINWKSKYKLCIITLDASGLSQKMPLG